VTLRSDEDKKQLLQGIRGEHLRRVIISSLSGTQQQKQEPEVSEEDLTNLSIEELERMEAELDSTIASNDEAIERLEYEQSREELIRRIQAKQERVEAQKRELGELQQAKSEDLDRGQVQPGD